MSKSRFIQWSGWLLIFSGIFFAASSISQLQPGSHYSFYGIYQLAIYALIPAMAFLTIGMIGVYLRYSKIEILSKLSIIAAILGAGAASLGWLVTMVLGDNFYIVFLAGWMLNLIGSTVFGGVTSTVKLLPKWNFAPLIGSALPLTVLLFALRGNTEVYGANWGAFAMLMAIAISWLLTGLALNSREPVRIQTATA